jgi:hypothetical protein
MKANERTQMMVKGIKEKQKALRETLELVILRDLVEKLDPDHNYGFDAETMMFNKEPKVPAKQEGPLGLGEVPDES